MARVELPGPVRVQVGLLLELVDLLEHQVADLDRDSRTCPALSAAPSDWPVAQYLLQKYPTRLLPSRSHR